MWCKWQELASAWVLSSHQRLMLSLAVSARASVACRIAKLLAVVESCDFESSVRTVWLIGLCPLKCGLFCIQAKTCVSSLLFGVWTAVPRWWRTFQAVGSCSYFSYWISGFYSILPGSANDLCHSTRIISVLTLPRWSLVQSNSFDLAVGTESFSQNSWLFLWFRPQLSAICFDPSTGSFTSVLI